ncbi:hypothetical protein [Chitinophaga japonensis]|uniref:Lipoprotein n=1 Tax=Chitinophaga japonensis TaxID=104662 RepID=A0A562T5I2_CHIJA|nr:hypothetical protein [Chitinophaga japonensis]TWI88260.1 hypothetical protein LX66_2345 [Chitinophaga japonensis]
MKKLAFVCVALLVGCSIAVAVKASKSAALPPYCHCEPDRVCNSTGAWGIRVQICP